MEKITIYLDNCCFNRPYDDQGFLSVNIETQAKLAIQDLVNDNRLGLIWSFILDFENNANPDGIIRNEIFLWRTKSSLIVYNNDDIVSKAKELNELGLGNKDSLHIASAIKGNAQYFITVDKGILSKKTLVKELLIISPIDFIAFLEETKK